MLLAIDIGNTNITIGGIENDEILFKSRIATGRLMTSDQYGVELRNIFAFHRYKETDVEDVIISSVVPPVFNSVRNGAYKFTGKEPMIVGSGLKTGINIHMDNPASVGSDLIVVAVAAVQKYEPPLLLIDMGTATTVTVVEEGNRYVGGVIIPGVRMSAEALSSRAAQLPGIQLDTPDRVIGKSTVECMRSGIMYSAADSLDGMIRRMEEELGKTTTAIATGGIAQFIVPLCQREIVLEKELLLEGLNVIYKKNKKKK